MFPLVYLGIFVAVGNVLILKVKILSIVYFFQVGGSARRLQRHATYLLVTLFH
jgi:hypothetical protein